MYSNPFLSQATSIQLDRVRRRERAVNISTAQSSEGELIEVKSKPRMIFGAVRKGNDDDEEAPIRGDEDSSGRVLMLRE